MSDVAGDEAWLDDLEPDDRERAERMLTPHGRALGSAAARALAVRDLVRKWARDADERAYVSRLWAQDWDSPEDSAGDS